MIKLNKIKIDSKNNGSAACAQAYRTYVYRFLAIILALTPLFQSYAAIYRMDIWHKKNDQDKDQYRVVLFDLHRDFKNCRIKYSQQQQLIDVLTKLKQAATQDVGKPLVIVEDSYDSPYLSISYLIQGFFNQGVHTVQRKWAEISGSYENEDIFSGISSMTGFKKLCDQQKIECLSIEFRYGFFPWTQSSDIKAVFKKIFNNPYSDIIDKYFRDFKIELDQAFAIAKFALEKKWTFKEKPALSSMFTNPLLFLEYIGDKFGAYERFVVQANLLNAAALVSILDLEQQNREYVFVFLGAYHTESLGLEPINCWEKLGYKRLLSLASEHNLLKMRNSLNGIDFYRNTYALPIENTLMETLPPLQKLPRVQYFRDEAEAKKAEASAAAQREKGIMKPPRSKL